MTFYFALENGLSLRKVPGTLAAMGKEGIVLRENLKGKQIIN